MKPTRQQIVDANPLPTYLASIGHPVTTQGVKTVCCCPFHEDKHPSMSVDVAKGVWYCFVCGFGGSVIDIVIRLKGCTVKESMHLLAESSGLIRKEDFEKPRLDATYEYKDAHGKTVMKVDRTEIGLKKRFAQYQEGPNGERINTVSGVQRTLYRLERWAGKQDIHIVEGEKCVHALERLGFDVTCNPGGSSAWVDAFAVYLKSKDVTIWPDNDAPGQKWAEAVVKSLDGQVKSVRTMKVPAPYNDVADLIDAQGDGMASEMIATIDKDTPRLTKSVNVPLLSAEECYNLYQKRVNTMDNEGVDLSKWLPSLHSCSRVLLPGDLAMFMSDTGAGKTSVLVNIAQSQRPIPTIFFQLELSPEPMCERFIARTHRIDTLEVERSTRRGDKYDVTMWDHVFICPKSKVTIEDMEEIIEQAELKIMRRPALVLVDYVGLMAGGTGKRYERLSTIAEGLKTLARSTETVIIMASQIRRDPDRMEIDLHDAKDSGSFENSAQLVMGAWRPSTNRMMIKILKQTKRAGQVTIECAFDGNRQMITELSNKQDMEAVNEGD